MASGTTLADAINMARFGDPVKAIEAFNRGAAAAGGDDVPMPRDSVYETEINGTPVRVLFVEPPDDAG